MSYVHYPRRQTVSREQRIRWLIYAFLSLVFFLTVHDLAEVQRTLGNYNRSQNEIVDSVQTGSSTREVALIVLGVAAAVSLVSYSSTIRLRPDPLTSRLLLAFALWSMLSVLWADDLSLAIKRLVPFAILCIAAFAIARMFSSRQIVHWVFVATGAFLIIAVVAELASGAFHPWLSEYRFAGLQHPNDEGIECGLLCLAAIAMAQIDARRRRLYFAAAAAASVFLLLTRSRTSLIATVIALGAYFLCSGSRSSKRLFLFGAVASFICLLLLLAAGLMPVVTNAFSFQRDGDSSVDSFAGRTEIWQDVAPYILQKPLIGHGYQAFWTPAHITEISDLEQWGVPDSHSAYIDYLLSLGAVGLALYLLCLGQGIRRACRIAQSSNSREAGFMGALLVFGAVDGFFESSIGEGSLLMFLCIIALVWTAFAARLEAPAEVLVRDLSAELERTVQA
jgi:exopolysaccharide production protein ExoQ